MIEYNDRKIFVDEKEYDFKGLNTSHIIWHLQEMYRPERFIDNLNENYTMPSHINYMSLAEGDTFDALLVDDKMFRYNKLTENDREEIQDYINKYAYATALVKLNECSNIIGCGLNHDYSLEESYSFISKCYDRLFENVSITTEKGRLIESFGTDGKINIYEGDSEYIRSAGSKRVVENWKNPFKFDNIIRYMFEGAEQVGDNVRIGFIDNNGVKMDAIFENTSLKLVQSGINLKHFLKRSNLVESYRTGTLLEYHQPFTLKAASLLAYEKSNDLLKLTLKDAFGNKGDIYAKLTIPVDDFIKKYKRKMNSIIAEPYAGDNIRETSGFLSDVAGDIESLSRIKNMSTDSDDPVLSYKVAPFTPVKVDGAEVVSRKRDDRNKFVVAVVDDEGTPYNLVYSYRGSNIVQDIEEMNNLADEMDFDDPSDVYSFYSMIDDYGNIERSAKRGISTKDRNYARNVKEEGEIMEGEGVQVSDIAPKLDQNVGTIQVKMKKRKARKVENDIADFKKSDLLISKMNEQDEFYGARGFIKDEQGHYHFGDYYINESGKVVHKSKLSEGYFSELDIKNQDDKIAFEKWKEENSDKIAAYYTQTYSKDLKNINQEVWDNIAKDIYDEERLPEIINKDIKEGEKLRKFKITLKHDDGKVNITTTASNKEQAIKQVCNSEKAPESAVVKVTELKESKDEADDAYYKVNDVTLKLMEVKPFIKEGTDAEKLYTNIIIELNNLQMELHNELLNESTFRDKAGSAGIQSYADMVYGQEPDSEYAKLFQLYMKNHDDIRDDLEKIKKAFNGNTKNPEYRKALQDIQDRDMANVEILHKAERIPEDQRGQMYQDYLEIRKANNDEFAKQRGYSSYDEYEKHMFGEGDKLDYEILDKPNDPEDFIVKDIPDDKLPVDLAKQGKCPYCTGPMSDEEYKVFGMCKDCYDNGVE